MKRVKIMLTSVLVVAVVGGALAFKANKATSVYCGVKGATAGTAECPVKPQQNYTTIQPNTFCTRVLGAKCNEPGRLLTDI